jgi:uncharacterized protein
LINQFNPGNFMISQNTPSTAFEGSGCIASGRLADVAQAAKTVVDRAAHSTSPLPVLIFNDATSEVIELDWRGSMDEFVARLALLQLAENVPDESAQPTPEPPDSPRGPGRPRMGVVAREITLLPRHWEWLAGQSGGASVALRKLVEVARRDSEAKDRVRQARNVGYKFMSTLAGHEIGFEEASRALFAGDQAGFELLIAAWPIDVQAHLNKILTDAFAL